MLIMSILLPVNMSEKQQDELQCRHRSDAAFCNSRSESLLFDQASLSQCLGLCTGPDKSGYQVNIFLVSPLKHILWVFIRSTLPRHLRHLIWVYIVCSGMSDKIHAIKYNI